MPRYLDPRADVVFKRIFADHPPLLISFLNAVLPLEEGRKIVHIDYLPSEQIPEIPVLKRTIVDVKCRDTEGRTFIVEMQMQWTDSFKQRSLFSSSQAFVKQLKRGEKYELLEPVYGLGIISAIYEETENWYHHYKLVEIGDNTHKNCIEHLQLVFVELTKFKVKTTEEKQLRLLWLRFLREINETTVIVPQELLAVSEIAEAIHLAEVSSYSEGEMLAYDSYWDAVSTEKTLSSGKFKEGLKEGIKEGLKEGIKKGKIQALLELILQKFGPLSTQELNTIAMKTQKATNEQLSQWTGRIFQANHIEDLFVP